MSAYQAQFRPRVSSCTRSRPLMSRLAECTPSSFQGNTVSSAAAVAVVSRSTTGAPLVPRWVRASVRK